MATARIIPCLLLKGNGFYKTARFRHPVYLGDPINILRIFNDKEADEIFILDISATSSSREPNIELLRDLASECFMPLGYGGGIRSIEQMATLFQTGFEKVSLNTSAHERPELVSAAARRFGSQSVVVSIDVKKTPFGGWQAMTHGGTRSSGRDPVEFARDMEDRGAGEILLNSIDRDGTMRGYDLPLIKAVAGAVGIPVIACGGAGNVRDLASAFITGGASAAAAGSFFVFQGPHRAVLISMPSQTELRACLS